MKLKDQVDRVSPNKAIIGDEQVHYSLKDMDTINVYINIIFLKANAITMAEAIFIVFSRMQHIA